LAVLVTTLIVFISIGYSLTTSLTHADLVRPTIQVSPLPNEIATMVAGSDVFYIPPEDQRAAIARIAKTGLPLYCGGLKKYAAVTFDDGPSTTTPELLRLLRKAGVPATFFAIGKNVQEFPDYARSYPSQGVTGNHTWDHPSLPSLSPDEIKAQLTQTNDVLTANAGPQYKIMRPPYGAHDAMSDRVIKKMGYVQSLWSADSADTLGATPEVLAKHVIDGLGPGSIILMHDRPAATLTALKKQILPAIRRSGLTMVTLPQLLALNPPSDGQLAEGPRGCSQAGKVNVSGSFGDLTSER
jgi:peptidoglycan/xylan/chitin deacetylase (PgdA/CDA1 family)